MQNIQKFLSKPFFQRRRASLVVSAVFGFLSDFPLPKFILNKIIQKYCAAFNVNIEKFQQPENDWKNFSSFFSRSLRKEHLAFGEGFISPVEGTIVSTGILNADQKLNIKNKNISASELCGHILVDEKMLYVIVYLGLENYHRVHSPADMQVKQQQWLGSGKRSTNIEAISNKPENYLYNQRLILSGESAEGTIVMTLIGAMVVGKIIPVATGIISWREKPSSTLVNLHKGEEIAYFSMGSTVALFVENKPGRELAFGEGDKIEVGQSLFK